MAGMSTMRWTPENDRILLLKLIETHAISINYQKICDAWPKDAPTIPTARAIAERFVKIKKLSAGGTTSAGTGTKQLTPARGRASAGKSFTTPTSSARKRTAGGKKKPSEYEEVEDLVTSEEEDGTPCPSTKSRKIGANRSPGGAALGGARLRESGNQYNPEDDPFRNGDFERTLKRAEEMSAEYAIYLNNTHSGIPSTTNSSFSGGNDAYQLEPKWLSTTSATNAGASNITATSTTSSTVGGLASTSPDLARRTSRMHISSSAGSQTDAYTKSSTNTSFVTAPESQPTTPSFINPTQLKTALNAPFKPVPKLEPAPRVRPSRMASKQAKKGMSAYIKEMKERDEEDGLRSSVEDSDESAFRGDDDDEDDYI